MRGDSSAVPETERFDLAHARPGNPAIMAVINRTTDSFYESAATHDEAIAAVEAVFDWKSFLGEDERV